MLTKCLDEHMIVVQGMRSLIPQIKIAGQICIEALENKNKILICGNGGSAADAQHIAAELSGRFKNDREALAGLALSTDTSVLTSISNDYGFEFVFSRQIEALAKDGDVLIAISTSGNSNNIIKAIESAKRKGVRIITLLGKDGGIMANEGDINIIIPSNNTPRIQEMHIMVGHMLCAMIDESCES